VTKQRAGRAIRTRDGEGTGTAARILDAAENVFAEAGYAGASTREMARRAGVPFGALHYHWGTKADLWAAVFERLRRRASDTIVRNLKPGRTAGETVDNMVDAFLDLLLDRPNTTRLLHRMALEPRDLHLPALTDDLIQLGLSALETWLPDRALDWPVTLVVLANGFLGAVADVDAQIAVLGGSVRTSRAARDRLRAELKRFARAAFEIEG
jgi:AcrR family transcriptional regulator